MIILQQFPPMMLLQKCWGKIIVNVYGSLGLGGLHSIAFKPNTKFFGVGCSSSSFESSESSQLKRRRLLV